MKTTARLLLLALTLVAFGGCTRNPGQDNGNAATSGVSDIRAGKPLRVAYVPSPPFVIKDATTGKLSGIFVDTLDEVARQGKFKIEYQEATWASMIPGLQNREYSVVATNVFPSVSRSLQVDFSHPMLFQAITAVAKKGDRRFQKSSDLARPSVRIATSSGSASLEFLKSAYPSKDFITLDTPDLGRAADEVMAGRADIAVMDASASARYVAAHSDAQVLFAEGPLAVRAAAFMLSTNDSELRQMLNNSLDVLFINGDIERIEARYRTQPPTWRSRTRPWK